MLIYGLVLIIVLLGWMNVYWWGKTRALKKRVSQLERQLYNAQRWQ